VNPIASIRIKIGPIDACLTLDEARDLREALNDALSHVPRPVRENVELPSLIRFTPWPTPQPWKGPITPTCLAKRRAGA
jgi:hypothetical protein